MLDNFKQKLAAPTPYGKNFPKKGPFFENKGTKIGCNMASDTFLLSVDPRSTTPTGTPPKEFIPLNETNGINAAAGAPRADTSQILKALADMAKTNTTTAPGMPSQATPINVPNLQNAYQQHMNSSVNPATSAPQYVQPVNVPGAAIGANPFAGMMSSASNFGLNQGMPGGQTNVQANPVIPQGTTPEALQQQVQLIQMLQAQGVPQDQWATVLQVLMAAGTVGGGVSSAPAQPSWQQNGGRDDSSRDRNGYDNSYNMRSPSGRYRSHRSRSRSPSGYNRRREPTPPRRRDSPSYGDYGRGGRSGRQERNRNEFRQRSPPAPYRRSDSPPPEQALPPPGPRNLQYDLSLPPNHIKGKPSQPHEIGSINTDIHKVLSRTLFVGGVT